MINICATDLRRDFFKAIKQVNDFESVCVVNRQGKNLVIMTEDEYNSLIETLAILSDHVEYDKIMHPDFSDSKVYDSVEEMLASIEE